jgi:hypothetical protein
VKEEEEEEEEKRRSAGKERCDSIKNEVERHRRAAATDEAMRDWRGEACVGSAV